MEAVLSALKTGQVIPQFLEASFNPSTLLTVTYNNKPIVAGEILTPSQVTQQPTIHYDADPNAFYTLVFLDPDVPSRAAPTFGPWLHWIVTNIPGNKLSEGEVLAEYIGSGPPEKTGLHRYCFFIFQQPSKLKFTGEYILPTTAAKRDKYEFERFVTKWNLSVKAATFYEAEFDDAVPGLYKMLETVKTQPQLIE
ncbi:phosphatidylethanolamine-binding protein PEBP [Heterostelium album PN500]|uniref:Phosphatidylethanolamine-binding protein PEBP n=1 Tax=Heterostelium pallidum (strain ATCC 26659 / Pp 5 / PN500) TaxID=670386 RepID=D3BIU2_HETP5|nr:phosphatidylethanolamine-binding protein PEBP [Heterostelium album PN500]EFA78716.1 phosphatidylethanolamine-binding protein PEBP [Heterostelium album PN500]|eukprot:XP_020430840.1 phosphatidylethanolamine-binding protein PEBP [Heterostelium album PN500]